MLLTILNPLLPRSVPVSELAAEFAGGRREVTASLYFSFAYCRIVSSTAGR